MAIKCHKCQFENPDDTIYCDKCASSPKPAEDISATKTLETWAEGLTTCTNVAARYHIIDELGKGGMGSVYRVLDKKLKEEGTFRLIGISLLSLIIRKP